MLSIPIEIFYNPFRKRTREFVTCKNIAPLSEIVAPDENIDKSTVKGCLRIIEHTNLAYVEPHRVIIKDKLFLFFNECDYFYVGNLRYKYHLSQLKDYIEKLL